MSYFGAVTKQGAVPQWSGGPEKGPYFGILDPPKGYIDPILILTWNPFETGNEIARKF